MPSELRTQQNRRAVLTPKEVGEIIDADPRTVREMIRKKQLYGFRCGTAWRIPVASVAKLLGVTPEEVMNYKEAAGI